MGCGKDYRLKKKDAVCIWYLVLRALDTIEDDVSISIEEKLKLLPEFYRFLEDPTWKYEKSTDKKRIVLEEFTTISSQFRQLKPLYREEIANVCHKMGTGMATYLTKPLDSIKDWDEYCHYVAGIVGVGLSRLFSIAGLERPEVAEDTDLSNSMGVFLQKTNMIGDYLEDIHQGRQLWPQQVWGRYCCAQLLELSSRQKIADALACLNELITNALIHIPDVLEYLSRVRNQSIFQFCAKPQVTALATLERCYNNRQVYIGVVKLRKGEAVYLMARATKLEIVKRLFARYLMKIERKIPTSDPSAAATRRAVAVALMACSPSSTDETVNNARDLRLMIFISFTMLLAAVVCYFWIRTF